MVASWAIDYDTQDCTIEAALSAVGEKWTFMVLREVFNGIRRFDDMQRRTGAPRQVLSDRLGRLVTAGILRKVPYQEAGQRARSEYRLTEKGVDLFPVIVALLEWGNKHAPGRRRAPGVTHPPRLRRAGRAPAGLRGRSRSGLGPRGNAGTRSGRPPAARAGR